MSQPNRPTSDLYPRSTRWKFEMERAMSGKGDWFTSHLLRLIAKADLVNREKIREGFPEEVAAYERWLASEGEFCHECNGEPYLVEMEKGNAEIVEIHVPCSQCGEWNRE